jgi:glutamate-1-semialdehyde aminotransferase
MNTFNNVTFTNNSAEVVPDALRIANGITGAIDVIGMIANIFGFHVVYTLTNTDHAALSLITQGGEEVVNELKFDGNCLMSSFLILFLERW